MMGIQTVSDGCGKTLPRQLDVAITGERTNGLVGGSPLPDDEFHWCRGCAKTAFDAVAEANR